MKLSVAANWDIELLEGLAEIPEATSIYAKLPFDVVGGGRAGMVVPLVDWDSAVAYIRAAHERDLSFCYLINAPCLGNLEQTREGKKQILEFIGQLVDIGVDSVSIANLAVISLVRHHFPHLAIRGSVLSWPTNLSRLKYQESLGVDPLIIPYSEFNRDFKMLAKIRSGLSCGMQLFVNVSCIYNCSYLAEHACSVGHASQSAQNTRQVGFFLDFYLWQCTRRRLLHPELFLMSRWIRPEDLHVYEAMGFDEFKIIDRSRSTSWLLRAVKAYADQRYDGNLLDILSLEMLGDPVGFHSDIDDQVRERMRYYGKEERQLMLRMLKLRRRLLTMEISIDNAELTDFLSGFQKIRCAEMYCGDCRYCHRYAERAVRYDRTEAEKLAKDINDLLEDCLTVGPFA
ncbi:MAG: U32 family peptidase [Proteobacteria bacterium]|nr:U32 family peptidase [Pseudomonadota bacterium]MBU4296429.1 U32 family peptidase [Pseudomonadota bacterium]MCG2748698.1 U32 family peptidase [Desulfobulbaceae bacterium]